MPRALSQDGKVVFGNSASALGDEMYRWTTAAGIQPLGVTYVPFAASLDGSAAVGWTTDNSELDAQPFRWTSGGAFATLGPFADTLSITNFIDAQLNDAGDVAQFSFDRDVARWSPGSGLEPHPNAIRATAISADGSQVAYFYAHGDGDYGSTDACLPAHAYDDPSSGFVKDECAYQGMWVAIFDLDDTGTVGVGFQLDEDNDYVAFYWTKDLGMSRLDRLLPAGVKSYPQAQASEWFAESYPPHPYISGDGQLVLAQAAAGECFVARIVGL